VFYHGLPRKYEVASIPKGERTMTRKQVHPISTLKMLPSIKVSSEFLGPRNQKVQTMAVWVTGLLRSGRQGTQVIDRGGRCLRDAETRIKQTGVTFCVLLGVQELSFVVHRLLSNTPRKGRVLMEEFWQKDSS
jgi:hypothetical protein